MKILIIEDEILTAKDLQKTILQINPDAEIIAIINSVEDSLAFFSSQHNIDLVFSDIQLGDGLSFEIFEKSRTQVPIIFCTAYNDYALKAFKSFGIDYILKPFSREAVEQALYKFSKLTTSTTQKTNSNYNEIFEVIKQQLIPPKASSILVYKGDKIIPVNAESIALFYIENEIVYALRFDQKKMDTNFKMDVLEQKLYPQFFRANRQFLVNRTAIKEASQHFHRKLQIHLLFPFPELILVGKEKVTQFLSWLTN